MKKYILATLLLAVSMIAFAVPAKREWRTYTQPDGTTIDVMLVGDEFYHFTVNRDGEQVRLDKDGFYKVVGAAPSRKAIKARREQSKFRRMRKDVGTKPNLAPRGLVILVNYDDMSFQPAHTKAVFDELCNSTNCTVNTYNGVKYPSAAEYFADQSNGAYRPVFDVVGPVTLSKEYDFYGHNIDAEGNPTDESSNETSDQYATDAVIEACILADKEFNIDFTQYDSDNDGYIDFVYVIYAGRGEADGGGANTIWPHNWEAIYTVLPFNEDGQYDPENGERMSCCYTEDDIVFDGVWLNNYAMSSELSSSGLGGIGTLCHEFGHVMGLPDWYDTDYGTNYTTYRTPNEWDIMDDGSYNGDGHCPPNYSPWEKYFFGWITPENLGSNGQALELTANGTDGYKAYQVNASGKQQGATTAGWCYYFENRQKLGWDKFIPTAGMIIWKVNFNADAWTGNVPNNSSTSGSPLYTLVCAEGTRVGKYAGGRDVFPYGTTDSWEGVEGKPLLDITRDGQVIDLVYIEPEANPVVTWVVDGEVLTTQTYTVFDPLELPAEILPLCDEETEFLGWTTEENWADPFSDPADLFTTAEGKKVLKSVTYYALFK